MDMYKEGTILPFEPFSDVRRTLRAFTLTPIQIGEPQQRQFFRFNMLRNT